MLGSSPFIGIGPSEHGGRYIATTQSLDCAVRAANRGDRGGAAAYLARALDRSPWPCEIEALLAECPSRDARGNLR